MSAESEIRGFVVIFDRPKMADPEGDLDSHGHVRLVPGCECSWFPPEHFGAGEEAEAREFAARRSHAVMLPVRNREVQR